MPISSNWRCSIVALNARDAMPDGGTSSAIARDGAETKDAAGARGPDSQPAARAITCGSPSSTPASAWIEQTLAKATEPFFTTKGPGKGTGLGLSMVHGLAAQSGGLLRIDSEPNVGTTVELWLPQATATARPARTVERLQAAPAAPRSPAAVLIVDDDHWC